VSIQQAETLREDEEFAFCRGRSNNDERPTILSVEPVSAHPVPGILERLEHKHALRAELGSDWAARPLTLVRRESIRSRSAPPDVSDRLMIPERLYGREREIDELRASFDRGAANGIPELVLAPLGLHDVGQLVGDALHCMPEEAQPLARLLQERPAGIRSWRSSSSRRWLKRVCSRSIRSRQPGGGTSTASALGDYTDNAVDLAGNLRRLSANPQEA